MDYDYGQIINNYGQNTQIKLLDLKEFVRFLLNFPTSSRSFKTHVCTEHLFSLGVLLVHSSFI